MGEGTALNSPKVAEDEEEEAELARVGAGLREPGIPSLPRSPSIDADETYPPVCMMKSSWLTASFPILALLPPTFALLPSPVSSPNYSSYDSKTREILALC